MPTHTLRRLFACLSFLLTTFAFSAGTTGVRADTPRALWVWSTGTIREDPAAQAEFFRFAAAPRGNTAHAITTVYFDGMETADFANPVTVASLRRFLTAAHARHLRVEFLCGEPGWATAAGRPKGLSYVRAVLAFNQASTPAAQYDGFQYDVEPYTLPGWPSAGLQNGLLALLDGANGLIHTSGRPLPLSLAIPRWFGQPQFDFLDRKIIDRTDSVVVMDYVSTPEQFLADPADVLDYAGKKHKAVWIGVETGPVADAPKSTFYALGNTALESMLAAAHPQFQKSSAFRGYAIHHYGAYTALKP